MAEAVAQRLEVSVHGTPITIREAAFINKGTIDSRLIEYAEAKGVKVYQKTPYNVAV